MNTTRALLSDFKVYSTFLLFLLFSCNNESSSNKSVNNPGLSIYNNNIVIDTLIISGIEEIQKLQDSADYVTAIKALNFLRQHPAFSLAHDSSKAIVYHKFGVMFFKQDDFHKAVIHLDTAISFQDDSPNHPLPKLANSYFVRSQAKSVLLKNQDALTDMRKAIRYIGTSASEKDLVEYYQNIALAFQRIGDFGQAKHYYEKALALNGSEENEQLAHIYNNMGLFYGAQGDFKLQEEMFQKALPIYRNLGKIQERNYLATDFNIGRNFLMTGEVDKAIKHLKNNLFKIKQTDEGYVALQEDCLFFLGYLEIQSQNYKNAKSYYSEVLALTSKATSSIYSVNKGRAYEGLGDVDMAQSKYTSAITNYHKAIQSLCMGFDTDDIYTVPSISNHLIINKQEVLRILELKASTFVARYQAKQNVSDLEAALENYHFLNALIISIRQQFKAASSRYHMVAESVPIYESATQVALQLYQQTKGQKYLESAFDFATKNKAIILQEGLQDEKAKFAGIPANLLEKENKLRKEHYLLEAEIIALETDGTNEKTLLEKKDRRFEVVQNYDQLIRQLEKEYPKYHRLKYEVKQAANSDAIAKLLPNQSALIEFFVGTKELFIFTISKKGLSHYSLPIPENLSKLCTDFRTMLQDNSHPPSSADYSAVAFSLYQILLEKPLADLERQQQIKHLIIVPDNYLLQISFDGLLYQALDSEGETVNWASSETPYLLRKYALSYAYSNNMFSDQESNKRIKKALKPFAGFGLEYDDYTLDGISQLNKLEVDTTLSRGMGKLYHSVSEVTKAKEIVGKGNIWTNKKATKKAFQQHAPKANILHLAMHGYETADNPLNAALIFTRQQEEADFLLKAADLYTMSLNADMTVLSACHTASGKVYKGEGVRSLASAFQYAGCPSLLATLWSVSDYSTKEIIVDFYKHLKEGESRDMALQKAKLNYLRSAQPSQTMPYFWTNLVLIGEAGPLAF